MSSKAAPAPKRRHDSESSSGADEEDDVKKAKSENGKNGAQAPTEVEPMEPAAALDVKVSEISNETLTVEWRSPHAGKSFLLVLENSNLKEESQSIEKNASDDEKCKVEFKDLKPLTTYKLTISAVVKGEMPVSVEATTEPSLEMPEIEEVQEGCAHLTLSPLPENEAKHVEAYLLLVRPLEDAKDYPASEIKDSGFLSKLESLVVSPFYLAHEFTQDELSEEDGGQIQVGSGAEVKNGKYGKLQDPKLTSGGNYRVVLVVIMNLDGKETLFAKESCQMLVK